MDLKDLKLNDLIKIAVTATIALILTLNLSIASNNTTTINNYITETTKKLDTIQQSNIELQKANNQAQGNITKVKHDVNQTLIITKKILKQVD